MTARIQSKKIISGRDLKGLGTKTNWLAVNCQSQSNRDSDSDMRMNGLAVSQSPAGKTMNTEAEDYLLLRAVTRQRLVKI
jgi:hypothetical protein